MAKRSTPKRGKQLKATPAKKKPSAAVRAKQREIQREIDELKRERAALDEKIARQTTAKRKAWREANALEYAQLAKRFAPTGLFDPASYSSKSAANRRLRSLRRQFREFIDPQKAFFVPTKSKRAQRAKEQAEKLGLPVTPKGFFFPREGARTLSLKFDKKRGEYQVITERPERRATTGQKRSTKRVYPIERPDSDNKKLAAIRAAGERLLGRKPRATDRLAFVVEAPHRGRSKSTYSTPDLLVNDLRKRYDRSLNAPAHLVGKRKSQFLGFLELVHVKKTTAGVWHGENAKLRKKRAKQKRKRRLL